MRSEVFDRTVATGAIVSDMTYNLTIGLVLCWGFLVNWVIYAGVSLMGAWALLRDWLRSEEERGVASARSVQDAGGGP